MPGDRDHVDYWEPMKRTRKHKGMTQLEERKLITKKLREMEGEATRTFNPPGPKRRPVLKSVPGTKFL